MISYSAYKPLLDPAKQLNMIVWSLN